MHIRIEGKLVQQIEERVVRSVELDGWLDALVAARPQKTPILPVGCRIYSRFGANETYVIEQPPQRRYLSWASEKPWGDTAHEGKWHLAFPYVIFACQPRENILRVFYRVASLAQSDDVLLRCNLGNIYRHSERVCMAPSEREESQDPSEMVSAFWASTFNLDLMDNFFEMARKDKRLSSLMKWEEASSENALFPLEVAWSTSDVALATLSAGGVE